MLHLLSIEVLKLQRNRSFLVLMLLFVISVFGINYMVLEIISPISISGIAFADVWSLVIYLSSYMLIIPCFAIIMHTCAEYTYRTHRQNIIDGLSRNQYITTKILFVILLALFATIIVLSNALVIGISSHTTISFAGLKFIIYFFIQAVAYFSFAFLSALVIKKTALTIGVFFAYAIIIENIMERNINALTVGLGKVGGFLPISSSEHLLVPEDISAMLNMTNTNMGGSQSEYAYLIASIVYIILCYIACYYKYKKQDL